MAHTLSTLPQFEEARKDIRAFDAPWKRLLRKSLAVRQATLSGRWLLATLQRAEHGKISKAGAQHSDKSFARHIGLEVARHVIEAETRKNFDYNPASSSHCVHLVLRLKDTEALEDFLGAVVGKHGLRKLNDRIHATRRAPEDEKPEALLATVESDRQGLHVHAVLYNRAPVSLEYFAHRAQEVFSGYTLVKEAHATVLADDTQLVRVSGYGLKRTVPVLTGRYPALYLGSIYSAREWRELAQAFSRVLS